MKVSLESRHAHAEKNRPINGCIAASYTLGGEEGSYDLTYLHSQHFILPCQVRFMHSRKHKLLRLPPAYDCTLLVRNPPLPSPSSTLVAFIP
jgi:hypothetical protein